MKCGRRKCGWVLLPLFWQIPLPVMAAAGKEGQIVFYEDKTAVLGERFLEMLRLAGKDMLPVLIAVLCLIVACMLAKRHKRPKEN